MSTSTLQVVNRSPRRKSKTHSRSSSNSDDPQTDTISTYSFVSSSEHTLFSEHKHSFEDQKSGYKYSHGAVSEKQLPFLPSSSQDVESHRRFNSESFSRYEPLEAYENSLTSIALLSGVLGADSTPYATEVESIPCAGVRIPHGPLKGLLAWRLVVRSPPSHSEKRNWWNGKSPTTDLEQDRRKTTMASSPKQSTSMSAAANSTKSLPLQSEPQENNQRISVHADAHSYASNIQQSIHSSPPTSQNAVITNFILDTSLPYSIISRDTLVALGYSSHRFPSPDIFNPHSPQWDDDSNQKGIITLSIQNVVTKLRIANPGEASRLGVQFFQDAGVGLFFAVGVGPILYLESARSLQDVPRTVLLAMPKMSLPQRIRALLGLSHP